MSTDIATYLKARFAVDESGCWLWTGVLDGNGYGCVQLAAYRNRGAHRVAYEAFSGPIAEGLQLDHLCRTRRCVNPAHLEQVTSRENTLRGESFAACNARQTHCRRNHLFTPENTYVWRNMRHCRSCRRVRREEKKGLNR